jgi:hypothetical protein
MKTIPPKNKEPYEKIRKILVQSNAREREGIFIIFLRITDILLYSRIGEKGELTYGQKDS